MSIPKVARASRSLTIMLLGSPKRLPKRPLSITGLPFASTSGVVVPSSAVFTFCSFVPKRSFMSISTRSFPTTPWTTMSLIVVSSPFSTLVITSSIPRPRPLKVSPRSETMVGTSLPITTSRFAMARSALAIISAVVAVFGSVTAVFFAQRVS